MKTLIFVASVVIGASFVGSLWMQYESSHTPKHIRESWTKQKA